MQSQKNFNNWKKQNNSCQQQPQQQYNGQPQFAPPQQFSQPQQYAQPGPPQTSVYCGTNQNQGASGGNNSEWQFEKGAICYASGSGDLLCNHCHLRVILKDSKAGNKYAECGACRLRGGMPGATFEGKGKGGGQKRAYTGNDGGGVPVSTDNAEYFEILGNKLDTLIQLQQAHLDTMNNFMQLHYGQEKMNQMYTETIEKTVA